MTRFVQPEKIEIDANERAVNEKSQYCFFVCTTFDSFLNDLSDLKDGATKVAKATAADTAAKATMADSATKASQDGEGNNIAATYAKKTEVTAGNFEYITFETDAKNATTFITIPDDFTIDNFAIIGWGTLVEESGQITDKYPYSMWSAYWHFQTLKTVAENQHRISFWHNYDSLVNKKAYVILAKIA